MQLNKLFYYGIATFSLTSLLCIYRYTEYTKLTTILLKETLDPWEKSLPGDYKTCVLMLTALNVNRSKQENEISNIFQWPYVNIENLWEKESDITGYCDGYNTGNFTPNRKLIEELKAYNFRYTVADTDVKLGEPIVLHIYTISKSGKKISTQGGDFFKIRAHPPTSRSGVAVSNIIDHRNGEYTAIINTFWVGLHEIYIHLGQTGKFVEVVQKLTAVSHPLGVEFLAEYSPLGCDRTMVSNWCIEGRTTRVQCSIDRYYVKSKTMCNLSNKNGENWFCGKPEDDFWCPDHNSYYTTRRKNALDIIEMFPEYDRCTDERKFIAGNVGSVMVAFTEQNMDNSRSSLPICGPGLENPSPSGYWLDGEWSSNLCKTTRYSEKLELSHMCFRNRVFHFLGDSTIRQWYHYIISARAQFSKFKAKEVLEYIDVWEPRKAVVTELNATFYHMSHGAPLQNGGKKSNLHFISNELDAIPTLSDGGKHTSISIGIGPHFFLFSPEIFLKRVLIIKKAANRLLKRNPDVTIIIKGTGTFIRGKGVGECCLSDWLSYRFHRVFKHVFDGTSIIYMGVWDMTLSHESQDLIHPVHVVIKEQLNMMFSFSCDRFTS